MLYKNKINPRTGAFNLVSANDVVSWKPGVTIYDDLPLVDNTLYDARMTNDTHHLYIWTKDAPTGDLTDWLDQGDIIDLTWAAISGKPNSLVVDIDDAVSKKHTQNTDTQLDNGFVNVNGYNLYVERANSHTGISIIADDGGVANQAAYLSLSGKDRALIYFNVNNVLKYRLQYTAADGGLSIVYNPSPATTYLFIKDDGKIGIGTITPAEKLDIMGNIKLSGNITDGTNISSPANIKSAIDLKHTQNTDTQLYNGLVSIVDNNITFNTPEPFSVEVMRISNDGKVGIGTSSPSEILDVHGNVSITSVAGGGLNLKSEVTDGGTLISYRNYANEMVAILTTVEVAGTVLSDSLRKDFTLLSANGFRIKTGSTVTSGNSNFVILNDGKIGINKITPLAQLDIDSSESEITTLKLKTALNQNVLHFLKADGNHLLRAFYDGYNFHHTWNCHLAYNMGGNTFNISGGTFVCKGDNNFGSTVSSLSGIHLKLGTYNYATVGVPLTGAGLLFNTMAWNDVNGYSIQSLARIVLTQLSVVSDDARFDIYNPYGDSSRLSILPDGKIGIGTITPAEKLDVNGNIKVNGTIEATGEIKFKVYSQDTEPTLGASQRVALWIDTNDNYRSYLVFRRAVVASGLTEQTKVELI